MSWWIPLLALGAIAAVLTIRWKWITPWRQLNELVEQIAQGKQPRTFLVTGNRDAWKIGVRLEDLLKKQQRLDDQVSQESAEMRAVFATLADALVVLDESQRIRFCNPAFEDFAGNGRSISSGTPLSQILRDVATTQTIESALKEKATRSTEMTRSDKYFQLLAMPVLRRGQEPNGIVAVFHDISRLKQTDEIRRDFVANVSHELRTPLSVFRGNLEVLLDDQNLSTEESRQIFSAMKRHSDRLNRLIEDLLMLARLEAKAMTLQIAPIDLGGFVARMAHDWNKRLQNRDLKVQVSVEENLPPLLADEFRLEQIMHNLLENAVSYSAEGKHISIAAKSQDGRAVLAVEDQGIGIPPGDLPRIFERFYRADKARSRERGGTGLGLSIVKHIAQLHGGDVRAESELGKGTRVSVLLPWEPNCLRNCNQTATAL
jgi:two-component system, OmpR family, phosphate regulon sensor histidine kinase PhoR